MTVSFRDYVIISDAFVAAQLDEGKIWDAIKAKLGAKASPEEVEAEIERLKKTKGKDVEKIKQTAASKNFHDRKAAELEKKAEREAKKPVGTVQAEIQKKLVAMPSVKLRAAQGKAVERDWVANMEGEELEGEALNEAATEFVVSYTSKGGGSTLRARIKGRDARDVRRKFNDMYFMKRILGIEPARLPKKKPESVEEQYGPLGPRTLEEA